MTSIIPELQSRVTHYDITNRVTNIFFNLSSKKLEAKKTLYNFRVTNSRFLKKIKF